MRILIKIVAAVLLSITLSGAVMAASEDLKDSVRMAFAKRVMRGEPQALGIEYNASGTARTITLDPLTFGFIMKLSVDGLSPYAQSLISGFQHACKPLLETPCEGLNCVQIAKQWQINLTSKEFTLNSDASDLGIPHDFVVDLKKNVLNSLILYKIQDKYEDEFFNLPMLARKGRLYNIRAGSADSSGYASLQDIIADFYTLDDRRKSLTDNFDVAPVVAEYEAFLSKAKKFRGGPENKDLRTLGDDAAYSKVPSEEYKAMKAELIKKAETYGAVIILGYMDVEYQTGYVRRCDNVLISSVPRVVYDNQKTELEALIRRLDAYTSNGYKVTSEPIPQEDVIKFACAWHAHKYFTKNPDLTASVQSHPATSGDTASSSALDPWLDVD